MISSYDHDADSLKVNQPAKCLGQRSSNSKAIVRHTDTDTRPTALCGPLKCGRLVGTCTIVKKSLTVSILSGPGL